MPHAETIRRRIPRCEHLFTLGLLVGLVMRSHAAFCEDRPIPRTVQEVSQDFDPRHDPLDVKVVREWNRDGIQFRYVTFHVGGFRKQASRVAAFYAFPKSDAKLPGLLHLHGGGQRAFLAEVEFYAKRGYACLSINWGGREMEEMKEGDANTDWGGVDPTQKNVPGYSNLKPGDRTVDSVESPRNNNWYLLTLAARRGLTFLENQPEVDPERLGVYGHSMGGNLTVYVAGTDRRVKAAAPSVGGSGFRTEPWPYQPQVRLETPNGDVGLFKSTLGFDSYASQIRCPLLWLGSTNDFHGIMDDTYRTGALIPDVEVRYVFAPHLNHRFTPNFSVSRPLWFDQYLKSSFQFPKTPQAKLTYDNERVPRFEVKPDTSQAVADVHLYYSVDPDPRARFWRSCEAKRDGENYSASLPIMSVDQPLFAFANVFYHCPKQPSEPYSSPTDRFAISSIIQIASPEELRSHHAQATDARSNLIDDFTSGWRDWYALSAENPHHWEYSTRKIAAPKWKGPAGSRLRVDLQVEKPNTLVVVLTENYFRFYRGKQQEFIATVNVGPGVESISLVPSDFKTTDGQALPSWENVDLLSFRAYFEKETVLLGSKSWVGAQPVFRKLSWEKP